MCRKIDPVRTGQNLRRVCKDRILSPDRIIALLKLSDRRIVYYWFSGQKLPSLDNLFALADILDVLVDDILVAREHWYYAYFRFVQGIGFVAMDNQED